MIAFLKGTVADMTENCLVLEVGGVGYELLVPGSLLASLSGTGQELKVYTYLQVREDAITLFGFLTRDDLWIFRQLIGVSGVGPKAGLSILSTLGADNLRFAILSDDAKKIAGAPGIGLKTARKVILELKDKFNPVEVVERAFFPEEPSGEMDADSRAAQDAVQALVALGYGNTEALKAVRAAKPSAGMSVEEILKAALKTGL